MALVEDGALRGERRRRRDGLPTPERKLVPIQAFIIGCTWPAVVANYLSGRQVGDPLTAEKEKKADEYVGKKADVTGDRRTQDELERANAEAAAEREKRLAELRKLADEIKPAGGAAFPPQPGGGIPPRGGG
jgi:hypothetical protein